MANGVIDTAMAGRYSTVDLAAVGVGTAIYVSVFIALMGVLMALTPIASQLYGAGRYAEIGEQVRQCAWLSLALGLASLIALKHPEPFFAVTRLAPEVEAKTRAYLSAASWGVPAALLFRVFYGFSNAVSRPRAVMVLNLIGLALKVPLNWVLMYGKFGLPEMGGVGCAVSGTLIWWVTCVLGWAWCYREADFRRYRVFARFSWPRWKHQWGIISLGLPIGVTFFVDVTGFTFMALFIARLGALNSAAHQIASNFAALLFMLPLSLGNAASVLVGQAIGARDPARARATALAGIATAVALGIALAFVVRAASGQIAGLYTADDEVKSIAGGLLALVAIYHVFDAIQAVASNVLRGYKRALVPMVIYAVALWGVGLCGGYALGLAGVDLGGSGDWRFAAAPMGAKGFWIAASASLALAGALVTLYFLRVSR
ncbi:MAG: MATE family efflux transporter, partial [Betaproteobacteria bacterium]|nr:MATE family efflux transporter [Betaproteobacteria bacterium]